MQRLPGRRPARSNHTYGIGPFTNLGVVAAAASCGGRNVATFASHTSRAVAGGSSITNSPRVYIERDKR